MTLPCNVRGLGRGGGRLLGSGTLAVAAACAVTLTSSPAGATGMQGHMYVTEMAVRSLPPGELRTLLDSRRDLWLDGSFLPDSGYAANDAYGEMAHWEQFVEAYINWIRSSFSPPFTSGAAADHVAVLMGAASHGMLDQTFDTLLVDRAAELGDDTSELDTGIDAWIVNDLGRKENPPIVVDTQGISQVFATGFGYDVSPDTIMSGLNTAKQAIGAVITLLAKNDQVFRDASPWAVTHYLDAGTPGSYPYSVPVVAGYMENIWRRLQGDHAMNRAIIGTWPNDGAADVPVDHASVSSFVTLFSGHGLVPGSVTSDSAFVQDAEGNRVPCEVRTRGDDWAGMIQLRPQADWAYHATYRVTLTSGIASLYGEHLASPFTLQFTTACAPGDEASCATAQGGGEGGCAISQARGSGAGGWWPVAAAAAVWVAARRRREGAQNADGREGRPSKRA